MTFYLCGKPECQGHRHRLTSAIGRRHLFYTIFLANR